MPKIIKDLESKLVSEARKQIEEVGYGAVTIRSIANACGVGVGTVYNYFSSKEALLASYILKDWQNCITAIDAVGRYSDTPQPVVRCMYDQLVGFAGRHEPVFRAEAALAPFAASFGQYHALLRSQLAQPLRKFCDSDFTADFVAESLLAWTMAGKPFEELYHLIGKLF